VLLAFLMCLTCLGVALADESSKGILYRVSGGKNEMLLLGSIHIGSPDMYPFSSTIMEAIEQADTLVFECDTESAEALQATMRMMSYPMGDNIENHLSPETYQLLCDAVQGTEYTMGMVKALKPWAVTSIFSMDTTAVEMGTEDVAEALELGVENQIRLAANEKKIAYLETTLEQLEMMDSFSPQLQDYMVYTACDLLLHPENLTEADAAVRKWPQWWRDGNAEAFAESYYLEGNAEELYPELMQEYHQKLNSQRNVRMAQRIAQMLEEGEGQRYFVTIGLLHLVLPDDSVGSELEKLGYTVERVF